MKQNFNNSSLLNDIKSKTNIYIKQGTLKESQMNLLYNLTRHKLNQDYINKLSQLLYDCKTVKNYSYKRINLDKAIYKYDKNNELYITLPNFNFKNKSVTYDNSINNKNSSIQHFTENGSNYLTNDTINYNNPNIPKKENNKKKLYLNDLFGGEEEQLNKIIKKLLLNENLDISKKTQKLIFDQLNMKYKFEGSEDKKQIISHKRVPTETTKKNKNINLIFPQIDKDRFPDYLEILKTKTNELNYIKHKNYKKYLSPLFFLGKNRAKYLNTIKYKSYNKLNRGKSFKVFKNISEDNQKYLKIMGNNIHTLNEINNGNKDIINSQMS